MTKDSYHSSEKGWNNGKRWKNIKMCVKDNPAILMEILYLYYVMFGLRLTINKY
jgi:hypothetical protein